MGRESNPPVYSMPEEVASLAEKITLRAVTMNKGAVRMSEMERKLILLERGLRPRKRPSFFAVFLSLSEQPKPLQRASDCHFCQYRPARLGERIAV